MFRLIRLPFATLLLFACASAPALAEEPPFSGPQAGEKLAPLPCRGVFDDVAGKEVDPVKTAADKPLVLIFVHEANRPSLALARVIATYAERRLPDGLHAAVIFLSRDATETEALLKRARHALITRVAHLISRDGLEGPGAYGLNRQMTMTVLVAKEGAVTANFALVQPSVEVDGPKILQAVVDVLGGGRAPTLAELGVNRERPAAGAPHPRLRELLAPVIRLQATDDEVKQAAGAVEKLAASDAAFKKAVGRSAKTIVDAGKLMNYGTPAAQAYLKKWAAWGE